MAKLLTHSTERVRSDVMDASPETTPGRHATPLGSHRFALPCVLLLVALATLPKLNNAFVWDDLALIVESEFIYEPANLLHVFGVDTMFAADRGKFQAVAQLDTYRPITIATFFLDGSLSGKHPLSYHLNNLLMHLVCVALVYFLGRRLLPAERWHAATWAALWFGLHPALGEAHVWINGRSDLWCTAFGLTGVLVWMRAADHGARRVPLLGLGGALFLLGLLSKEALLPALFVLALWRVGVFSCRLSEIDVSLRNLQHLVPLALSAAIYLVLRGAALSGLHVSAGGPQLELALTRLPVLLLDGVVSSAFPSSLMPRYLEEAYTRLGYAALWGCAALVLVLGSVVWLNRRRLQLFAFGLTWFAAVLAPASLITTLHWYGFNRYLYLPLAVLSISLADLLAHGVERLRTLARPSLVRACQSAAVLYLALFGLRLLESTQYWDGPLAFYTRLIVDQPTASHGHGGLGKWLVDQGRPDLGIPPLEKAVELNSRDSRYLNNLGVAYLRVGRRSDALAISMLGLRRFPHEEKFGRLRKLASEH